jgi:hypothetical protein
VLLLKLTADFKKFIHRNRKWNYFGAAAALALQTGHYFSVTAVKHNPGAARGAHRFPPSTHLLKDHDATWAATIRTTKTAISFWSGMLSRYANITYLPVSRNSRHLAGVHLRIDALRGVSSSSGIAASTRAIAASKSAMALSLMAFSSMRSISSWFSSDLVLSAVLPTYYLPSWSVKLEYD